VPSYLLLNFLLSAKVPNTFGVRKDNMVATVPMENMKMDMKISMEMDMSVFSWIACEILH